MMLAAEFARNLTARQSDFSFSTEERGAFWMAERKGEGLRSAEDEAGGAVVSKGRRRRVKGALIAQVCAASLPSRALLTSFAVSRRLSVCGERPEAPGRRRRTHPFAHFRVVSLSTACLSS